MDNLTTAIYVRVSTMKDSQKDSPEHQRGLCEEKARMLDLSVRYLYEDRDSGTSIVGRNEIQKLIKDAKNGLFQNIIFASLSRFSRDTLDSLNLKRVLVDALGIRVISIEEGYDSAKDNDELKFQIISAVNQKLSEQISLASKRGIRQSALKGNYTGSITPYGYKKVTIGDRKTLIPDEATKHIVQLIYRLYTTEKMGDKAIVNYLNNELEIPSYKGGKWGVSSIQRILKNEVYTGRNVFNKYEIKKVYNDINNMANRTKRQVMRKESKWERTDFQTHEAIVDDDTFELVQKIRFERGGGQRGGIRARVNVFAGMIFCKHCGSSMVVMKSKGRKTSKKGQEYRYLFCSKRRRQGDTGCINKLWIPYYDFRDAIIESVSVKLRKAIDIDQATERSKDRIIISNELEKNKEKDAKKLEKALENNRKLIFELRKLKMLGEVDEEQYLFEKELYEKDIATLQEQLRKTQDEHVKQMDLQIVYDEIRAGLEELVLLSSDNVDQLRLTLSKLIKKIVVSVDGEVEIYSVLGKV